MGDITAIGIALGCIALTFGLLRLCGALTPKEPSTRATSAKGNTP